MKTSRMNRSHLVALTALVVVSALPLQATADVPAPTGTETTPPPLPAPPPAPAPAPAMPPPPPLPEPIPLPPPPPAPSVTRNTVAWWAAGIAVVGAGAATAFGVLALQNQSDYNKGPTYSNADGGNNNAAYADGCIFLAAAAGVTSLVLFLTNDPTPSAPAAAKTSLTLSASPVVTPHGGGAGAVLRF